MLSEDGAADRADEGAAGVTEQLKSGKSDVMGWNDE